MKSLISIPDSISGQILWKTTEIQRTQRLWETLLICFWIHRAKWRWNGSKENPHKPKMTRSTSPETRVCEHSDALGTPGNLGCPSEGAFPGEKKRSPVSMWQAGDTETKIGTEPLYSSTEKWVRVENQLNKGTRPQRDSGKCACLSLRPAAFTSYVWNSHLTAQFYLISKEELSPMLLKQFHKIEEKVMSRLRSSCLLYLFKLLPSSWFIVGDHVHLKVYSFLLAFPDLESAHI